ncbi:hypothetical protein DPM19_11545 [Actinomadura craniellae]|uniref:ATP-binding protein n=1 Tax=Actinomadura craniellae TaxID=2231787 RepID=A0A365HAN8_9ACTN|nr:ATP-binding protein [Actinomadura craniellae]RAY15333.1 hypothetical protein DPM19_11545 [Actinomadura craniellae]
MSIEAPSMPLKRVRLRNRPQAASVARRDAVLTARDWGVPEDVIERLEVCVSEIVTNAHRHAAPPDGCVSHPPAGREEPVPVGPCPCEGADYGGAPLVESKQAFPGGDPGPALWAERALPDGPLPAAVLDEPADERRWEIPATRALTVRGRENGGEPPIVMVLDRRGDRLRVEVRDGSPVLPPGRVVGDAYGESGRGLFIVAHLADGHGVHRIPTGKSVWFELVAW